MKLVSVGHGTIRLSVSRMQSLTIYCFYSATDEGFCYEIFALNFLKILFSEAVSITSRLTIY